MIAIIVATSAATIPAQLIIIPGRSSARVFNVPQCRSNKSSSVSKPPSSPFGAIQYVAKISSSVLSAKPLRHRYVFFAKTFHSLFLAVHCHRSKHFIVIDECGVVSMRLVFNRLNAMHHLWCCCGALIVLLFITNGTAVYH